MLELRTFFCTRNFVEFPDWKVNQREIHAKTQIKEDQIIINVNYPLAVSKGETTYLFEDFEVDIPLRIGGAYEASKLYLGQEEEGICVDCLLEIALKYDLYVDMIDYDEETTIFIVKDDYELNGKTLRWVFANKYEVRK
jgi:hypothetical protein